MRFRAVAALALLALLLQPAPAAAWGFAAHQFIMRRALELLPPELKPFFESRRDEVVVRVKDPDLWRNAGWPEDANHFMDFGVKEYGDYPFRELPRDYTAALEKFGQATIQKNGRLPWRFAEAFGNLRRGFEGFGRNSSYAPDDVVLFAGMAAHYIQDATMPLHAADNYDGIQTGQRGIHSRFEMELFERYQDRLTLAPPAMAPVSQPDDLAWEILLDSYQQVEPLLKADKEAAAGLEFYDTTYFDRFYRNAGPLMQRQISRAIAATAAVITGAWIEAGRPPVGALKPRPPQKIGGR